MIPIIWILSRIKIKKIRIEYDKGDTDEFIKELIAGHSMYNGIAISEKLSDILANYIDVETTEDLTDLRHQIDEIDDKILEILAKRMRISGEVAQYKKENSMSVLQAGRYDEILTKRSEQGASMGMSPEFIKEVFEAIHAESVRKQMEIINQ